MAVTRSVTQQPQSQAPVTATNKMVVWFKDVNKGSIALAGGKGANLGEMVQAGIPVPPGFIVTASAYYFFLGKTNLTRAIRRLLENLDHNDSYTLNDVASRVKNAILRAKMPDEVAAAVRRAYRELGQGYVAVRSSATAEDLPDASFAGQQSTYLNIQGEEEVIKAVQDCWASLFEARAIFYRQENHFDHFKVGIAVPVQRMVQSSTSGVMFTVDPVTNNRDHVVIEAAYGLGEAVVSGHVTPDLYVVNKEPLSILERKVARQEWRLVRNPEPKSNGNEPNYKQMIGPAHQSQQKLADVDILALARIGLQLEEHYGNPQDIEWAEEDGQFFIVQARPVTTLEKEKSIEPEEAPKIAAQVLLSGASASPGSGIGPVAVLASAAEIGKVKQGDVLVTEMTTPDFVPAMKRAAAIVTDKGGRTCHAAIVSRELGIPCVVGAEHATSVLKQGQVVTVDGSQGKVYEGEVQIKRKEATESKRHVRTMTKLYVNLADPELADRVAERFVDGVGLLRAEFIVAHMGEHPRYLLDQGKGEQFTENLARGIEQFAKAFNPRPVVYRLTDFKTNEYRNLKGGEKFEDVEENPMLGYRGASRYISDIEVFKMEIEALKRVRKDYPNVWVMVPFVRTPQELAQVKRLMEQEGLQRSETMKLWMMTEIPSNILLLDKFIDVGIDGISIGSNDLTQLILGVDRDNSRLANLFDERDPAVMIALEKAVTTAKKRGITCSICGQAPSYYPELTAKLVQWGITSVSVSPDMIDRTRQIIAEVEERLRILPKQVE